MQYLLRTLKMIFTYSGRDTRKQFWMSYLFFIIIAVAYTFAGSLVANVNQQIAQIMFIPLIIFYVVSMIAFISASARRLHDIDKSGWWYLISLIPFAGFALLFYWAQDSQPGSNKYSPNPKGIE